MIHRPLDCVVARRPALGQRQSADEVQHFISTLPIEVPQSSSFGCQIFELGVLGFGLSIDGKIGVSVFPKIKEFFVRFAGACVIAHQISARPS